MLIINQQKYKTIASTLTRATMEVYKDCPEKVQTVLTWREWFTWHRCNLAARESGLECACVNNDNFTVLVSGGGRHCWVSTCTVWLSHSKWLSKKSNKSASNFALSLNIPPWILLGWFRRPQLWTTGDWQLHHNNTPALASHLLQFFWQNIKSPRWLSPLTAQMSRPTTSGFSQS